MKRFLYLTTIGFIKYLNLLIQEHHWKIPLPNALPF